MNNPATIPAHVMREIERRMAFGADLQQTRRHVLRHHGLQQWRWYLDNPFAGHADRRRQAAASIREVRRLIAENGFDVATVCAIARDPDAYAFCDGGGATAATIND